jgi:hypothetical protein
LNLNQSSLYFLLLQLPLHDGQLPFCRAGLSAQCGDRLVGLHASLLQFQPLEARYDGAYEGDHDKGAGPINESARPLSQVWVPYVYGILGAACLCAAFLAGGGMSYCLIRWDDGLGRWWLYVAFGLLATAGFFAFHGVALLSPRNLGFF